MAYASWSVVFGEQPSAAKWNILGTNDASFNNGTGISNLEIGSGHTSLKNDYKFWVYLNAATNSSTTATLITFDTKVFDTNTNYSTSTGKFVAPVAGFYGFTAVVGNTIDAATAVTAYLYLNGVVSLIGVSYIPNGTNVSTNSVVTGMISLAANDYVQVYYRGAAAQPIQVGQPTCFFQGILLSQT